MNNKRALAAIKRLTFADCLLFFNAKADDRDRQIASMVDDTNDGVRAGDQRRMTRAEIFAYVNALVRRWQDEGDTTSPQELMRDGFVLLHWRRRNDELHQRYEQQQRSLS